MNKLTYKEAEALIFDAYFQDKIRPYDCKFCFCGTLSPDLLWNNQDGEIRRMFDLPQPLPKYPYSVCEYQKMEAALFRGIDEIIPTTKFWAKHRSPIYEDAVFIGMTYALEELKNIHIERGEVIDNPINLKKRELIKL